MEKRVFRWGDDDRALPEVYLDQRLAGYRRSIFNVIGVGDMSKSVIEAEDDPEAQPLIAAPAHGFLVQYVACDPGQGAALHAHDTEEVFIALTGAWAIRWMDGETQREVVLKPFDLVFVPTKVFRSFHNVADERAAMFAILGGPDTGKVAWHPTIIAAAKETGLSIDEDGKLLRAE